jgi:hypothetical protein
LSVKSTAVTTSSSGGSTPQAVSYADIAKFLNNNNNNNTNNNNNNNNGSNVVVDNWPTITSSTTVTMISSKPFGEQQPDAVSYVAGLTSTSNIVVSNFAVSSFYKTFKRVFK